MDKITKEFFLNKYFFSKGATGSFAIKEMEIIFTLEHHQSDGSGFDLRIVFPHYPNQPMFPRHTHWTYFRELYEDKEIVEIPRTVFDWMVKMKNNPTT